MNNKIDKHEFYHSKTWKNKRARVLRRDGYIDQLALMLYDKTLPGETVHHIFPLEEYPEYRLCSWNLITVSAVTHDKLHNRTDNSLTELGLQLMRKTIRERDILGITEQVTLIMGMPGTGKSTFARNNCDSNTIVYDLDRIAAAFSMQEFDSDSIHENARRMANDLLNGFTANAQRYADKIVVIRTAPPIFELEMINPDMIIFFSGDCNRYGIKDIQRKRDRQRAALSWAEENEIEVKIVSPPGHRATI